MAWSVICINAVTVHLHKDYMRWHLYFIIPQVQPSNSLFCQDWKVGKKNYDKAILSRCADLYYRARFQGGWCWQSSHSNSFTQMSSPGSSPTIWGLFCSQTQTLQYKNSLWKPKSSGFSKFLGDPVKDKTLTSPSVQTIPIYTENLLNFSIILVYSAKAF